MDEVQNLSNSENGTGSVEENFREDGTYMCDGGCYL
jgi:hypothetical protein